jgi:Ca2+-binding EF-hand superfamily protein
MDRNGKVDTKEMEKIIEAIYDLLGEEHRKGENSPSERVKVIMHKLDKDGNGYLSEAGIFSLNYFEKLVFLI